MTTCLERIKNAGKIRVGVSSDLLLLEKFEVDLAHLIAAELFGNENQIEFVKLKIIGGNERIDSLRENRVDIVISVFKIMKERLGEVDFSKPYFIDKVALLVLKEGPIKHLSDLKGKKVAIEEKSATVNDFQKDFPDAKVVIVKNKEQGIRALKDHTVEAFAHQFTHLILVKTSLNNGDKFAILDTENHFSPKQYAVGIKKGCSDLLKFVNDCLSKFERNGNLNKLMKKHGLL